jgi:hypothetical protein
MGTIGRVHAALMRFIDSLVGHDRLRIGSFGDEVALSWSLTGDKEVLRRVVAEELWPGGTSPLWRALDTAVTSLASESGRKVVVVLTDGIDHAPGGTQGLPQLPGGFSGLKKTIDSSQDLIVYAIGFGDPSQGQRLRGDIVSLVQASGGGHVDVSPAADLGSVLDDVGRELRQQYVIGFSPRHADGLTHPVEVRVSVPGAVVRSRRTYRAPTKLREVADRIGTGGRQ